VICLFRLLCVCLLFHRLAFFHAFPNSRSTFSLNLRFLSHNFLRHSVDGLFVLGELLKSQPHSLLSVFRSHSFVNTVVIVIGHTQRDEAMQLVSDAVCAGVFNDLGSGSNVDLCVIGRDKVDYIRPAKRANIKAPGYVLRHKLFSWSAQYYVSVNRECS